MTDVQTFNLGPGLSAPVDFLAMDSVLRVDEPRTPSVPHALTQAIFSAQNPYWQKGQARGFYVSQEVRLAGFFHPDLKTNGEPTACFGYWATRNAGSINAKVFAALESWARALGTKVLLGPLNMKTAYDYRLRLDDFDGPGFWGEPSNPPYYVALLKELGFRVGESYMTDFINDLAPIRKLAKSKLGNIREDGSGGRFVSFSIPLFRQYQREILELGNQLFQENFAFQRVEPFDFAVLYNEPLLQRLCTRTSFLLFDAQERLRGLCMSFPHPGEERCLLIKTIGIDPEFRNGGRTFVACLKQIFKGSENYDRIAFCLMTEDNQVHRLTAKYSEQRRTYGLFRKALGESHESPSKTMSGLHE